MRNRLSWILHLFIICVSLSLASGPGDEEPPLPEEIDTEDSGWVYGRIEYEHDLLAPNLYFMTLLAHPKSDVPDLLGAYVFTDVGVHIRLRGVHVPRSLQQAEDLHRPHEWRRRERQRWNTAMQYLWSIMERTKTFRLHNLEKIDNTTILADLEFLLGGEWHDLAYTMVKDEIVRAVGETDIKWDAGSQEYGLENPSIP